jgi:hypothetical protein
MNKKQDRKTTVGLQYRQYVTQRLARYFKIKKEDLKETTEHDFDVLYYPLLEEQGFYKLIYAGHYNKIILDKLFDGAKFIASGIYESYQTAQTLVPAKRADDVMVAIHMNGGKIWVVYSSDFYEGIGGIFVQTSEGGFVIEPLDNYLAHHHPHLD